MTKWMKKASAVGFAALLAGSQQFAHASAFMPPAATKIAEGVDSIYWFLLVASFISFVLLIGGMVYFVFKYQRRTANDQTAYITHNHTLEFVWSFVPFVIFMVVFGWGWKVYHDMRKMPENALEIHALAKKWDWRFLYKNGKEVVSGLDANNKRLPPTMVVPVGKPVKLIMASERINPKGDDPKDRPVLHSFYLPAARVKQDLVPGRFTAVWFQLEQPGEYWVFCTEYCGAGHSAMTAKVKAVPQAEFEEWIASEGTGELTLADLGKNLYSSKACIGCHSLDGSRVVGPTFKGGWGAKRQVEGGEAQFDEDYARESILNPNAKIVAGYPAGVMPAYAGQLTDEEVTQIIEFLKTLAK